MRIVQTMLQRTKIIRDVQESFFELFSQTGGKHFIYFIIRDRTFKLKYQDFHINLRNSKKYFLARGVQGGRGGNIFIFFIIRDRSFKHEYKYFHINQINSKKYFLPGASQGERGNMYFLYH